MGGGKFWDMYKGKSSYDSFDESDGDIVDSLGMEADSVDDFDTTRQAAEVDQPEDRYRKMKDAIAKAAAAVEKMNNEKKNKDETIIVAMRVGIYCTSLFNLGIFISPFVSS